MRLRRLIAAPALPSPRSCLPYLWYRTMFERYFLPPPPQDLPFFERLSPGELMARTSGDSLTLRGIVSTTVYQVGGLLGAWMRGDGFDGVVS